MAVLEKYQMLSLAENVVKSALQKGAAEAEAYVYEGQATNVGVERALPMSPLQPMPDRLKQDRCHGPIGLQNIIS